MIRRLFVYFTVVLTLCFIISCKKDSPSSDNGTTTKEHNTSSDVKKEDGLVIRDDTASIADTTKQDKQTIQSKDSVLSETPGNNGSETITQSDTRIYDVAEQLPEFPGGLKALNKYISENTKDIASSVALKKSVRTMISFVVEKDGSLSDIYVAKSSGNTELDNEAKKVVEKMPAWSPAQNNGTDVRMKYIVPVIFNPQN